MNLPTDQQPEAPRGGTNGEGESNSSSETANRIGGWHPDEQRHRIVERGYWRIQSFMTAFTLLFSLAAVAASTASTWFAWRAVSASVAQVDIMKDTENYQLRPYVYTVITNPVPDIAVGAKNYFSVRFINGGQTPAYSPAIALHWRPIELPVDDIEKYVGTHPEYGKALPGDYIFKDHTQDLRSSQPLILSQEAVTAIENRRALIFFWGEGLYVDVWGCRHFTNFCAMYGLDLDKRPVTFSCELHNDVDDASQCKR